jgi:carboxynorspermidine decarboxylase
MKLNFDINNIKTPCYIVDEALLEKNLKILKKISLISGCKILLAQKAFSMFYLYPLIAKYLDGTAASGLFEARLGFQNMGKETHVFSAAYCEDEIDELFEICDHIVFNSFNEWEKYRIRAIKSRKKFGMRINPQHSTQTHAIYDPCAKGSRLGVTAQNFRTDLLDGISGLHFHTLCEQNSDALASTLAAVENGFGKFLPQMEWINFGGGHYITHSSYDINTLITCVKNFKEKYNLDVYLEPGEAVALNAGFLVSTVLDIVNNDLNIAILDVSAACHMPDVLEMPYIPTVIGASPPGKKQHHYRLAGATCLAGDIIGDYAFDMPLKTGDKIVFNDMAIYTMVKNNTFNGTKLPSIAVADVQGNLKIIKEFGYNDFKQRLS